MDGVLNINKPSGPTSHDVVAHIRRVAHVKRVGHAGTLDPLASGVLVVCLGQATRIIEYMADWIKTYRATGILGAETDTEDTTGEVLRESDCSRLTMTDVQAVLPRFSGRILQVPPMMSAVHHEGRRLYELARAGQTVERSPRPVQVYSLELLSFVPGEKARFTIDVSCSGGTYIRTLCADIGNALGCGAHMSSLVRAAVGGFRVEDAVTLEALEHEASEGRLQDILHPLDEVLSGMPAVGVAGEDEALVMNGVVLALTRFDGAPSEGESVRIRARDGRLLGIGIVRSGPSGELEIRPRKVVAGAQ